jgi:hypothetical protein
VNKRTTRCVPRAFPFDRFRERFEDDCAARTLPEQTDVGGVESGSKCANADP